MTFHYPNKPYIVANHLQKQFVVPNLSKNGLFISDEDHSILYPSGQHLARYNLDTKKCDFVCRDPPSLTSNEYDGKILLITL